YPGAGFLPAAPPAGSPLPALGLPSVDGAAPVLAPPVSGTSELVLKDVKPVVLAGPAEMTVVTVADSGPVSAPSAQVVGWGSAGLGGFALMFWLGSRTRARRPIARGGDSG
ncbi:hypothetical protein, partial [Actinocorallia lasiicapitis]